MSTDHGPNPTVAQYSLSEIQRIAADVLSGLDAELYLFGSWARGDARRTSDIDIAVRLPQMANETVITELRSRFDNSNIPYRIDVVDLRHVVPAFREQILQEGIRLTLSVTTD